MKFPEKAYAGATPKPARLTHALPSSASTDVVGLAFMQGRSTGVGQLP